ncbi:MAG: hypothetical protein PF482_11665 [Desulfobacteraceae bacterium]|jgi:hypothetical protein|nr:hypothetical protein [Desulfobacteraceae bacterium]
MKINTLQFDLLSQFNNNWEKYFKRLCLDLSIGKIGRLETHPLSGEIINLIKEKGGSLPFFSSGKIIWCTMAPDSSQLKKAVEQLQSWILPSYGWQGTGDGYKIPNPTGSKFQRAITGVSPSSYFRWQSMPEQYSAIERKLAIRYQLEGTRPNRVRVARPSLYELRTQFNTALTLGDRVVAENAIGLIDTYELDKALNTQMMRIHLWHHFREFENIKSCHNLPSLLAQSSLPYKINEYIREATGEIAPKLESIEKSTIHQPGESIDSDWERWFDFLINQKDIESAQDWLEEKNAIAVVDLKQSQIKEYSEFWDSIFLNDRLKEQHKVSINDGIISFLGDFVREPEFPRTNYAELYLSLLRLWGEMNAGINKGCEEGHILLELASALFQLNHKIDEVKQIIEDWWEARAVPSQLPFALDAVELLTYQHPDNQAATNLWIDAADQAKRNLQQLIESERDLWRTAGARIGLDEDTIHEYFPIDQEESPKDFLSIANLQKVAIVCMRQEQARVAAEMIRCRTAANLFLISSKVAGTDTEQARSCDVVLFVWMATTHAVFRAFDGFDRRKLCYVQGTGPASIVRALERWALDKSN